MQTNTLKKRLQAGEAVIGSWLSVAHPTIGEVMGQAGFDWLIADMEHGILSLEALQSLMIAVAGTGATPIVRVAWNDPVRIKQVLETAPMGLVIPQVNSAAEAEAAVRAASYPPRGIRGIGCQRGAGFGAWFTEYLQRANEELLIIVQVEHEQAVANIEEIVAVEGVDVIFIGANDLSASMGLIGQPGHPRVLEAIRRVLATAQRRGIAAGLMASDADEASRRFSEGFQFVGVGHDVGLLSLVCRDLCAKVVRGQRTVAANPAAVA
jgi:2-keto-3-deoxy-L-rhamnonate aldolase RhmA